MQVLAFDHPPSPAASASPRPDTRAARERRLATFLALSLLLHALGLWRLAPPLAPFAVGERDVTPGSPLVARLNEPPRIAPPPATAAPPPLASSPPPSAPPVRRVPPTAMARAAPERAPPILDAPVPSVPAPLRVPELAPPLPQPVEPPRTEPLAKQYEDLSAYVAAQRLARGEPSEGYATAKAGRRDDESARRDRALAENLASLNAPSGEARNSGGLFQITRLGYNDAEFTFFGWHQDIKRRASQRIEVRRGSEPDIKVAVVRRMIAIIRQYEQEDFTWRSNRLGRDVTLSARQSDTAGLEDFLLREFF